MPRFPILARVSPRSSVFQIFNFPVRHVRVRDKIAFHTIPNSVSLGELA